jgi:hypothetical protein
VDVGEDTMQRKDMNSLMDAYRSVVLGESVEIDEARQMKDPKKDSMVSKGGKTIVIDKSKEKEYLAKGWTLSEKKKLDPVDDKANDKDFKDRKDKDIDNDGDVDSSDEFLHKKRAATDDAIDGGDKPAKNAKPKKGVNPFKKEEVEVEDEDEDGKKKSKKPNPFAKKKDDSEEKDSEDKSEDDSDDDEEKEVKDPKVAGKKDDKKKVASNAKTAEISKIGEGYTTNEEIKGLADAISDLHNMWESAAKKSVKGATDKGEEIDSKDSPKAKEFAKKSGKGSVEVNNDDEEGHALATKAGSTGTKPNSGKRSVDNAKGDNKIVKSTVAEETAEDIIAQAQNIIDGKTMVELADMTSKKDKEKNPHDARTKDAKNFLERMAKRRGYVKGEK